MNSKSKINVSPFGVFLNNSGAVVDRFTIDSVVEDIFSHAERLDRERSKEAPHAVIVWIDGRWKELKDIISA